jgi:multidrug efflux pump subunit AcrA (membrane-fusion protein)
VPLPNQPLPILPSNNLPPVAVPGTSAAANPSTVPVSPPTPTSLANAIEVSGVIEAGGTVSAIVQVPGEPTSRYVNVGDYLAGGSVLVKRIDVTGEPVVILEQGGVEVIRSVGSSTIAGAL